MMKMMMMMMMMMNPEDRDSYGASNVSGKADGLENNSRIDGHVGTERQAG